jgi:hypothetical protein
VQKVMRVQLRGGILVLVVGSVEGGSVEGEA